MKLQRILLFVLLLGILSTIASPGQTRQPRFYLGGYGGLNYNIHSADFQNLEGYYTCCPQFKSGDGLGFAFSGLFQYPIDQKFYIGARLGYTNISGQILENQEIGNTEVRQTSPPYETIELMKAEVEHSMTGNISMIALEPIAGYKLFKGFHVMAGFSLGFMISPTFDQYEELITPENVVFAEEDALRRNVVEGDELPEAKSFQVHLLLGLGYDLPIGYETYLTPEIKYYLPFIDITSRDWKISPIAIGLALKTPIFPPTKKPIIDENIFYRDTVTKIIAGIEKPTLKKTYSDIQTETEEIANAIINRTIVTEKYELQIPKETKLYTDLKVTGISADGKRQENPRIIIEETETEEMFPLLPYVFFDNGSAKLDDTGMQLVGNKQDSKPEDFTEDELPWNTLEIYSNLLDIVGFRMKQNPNSNITLTGCNNNLGVEENNLELSRNRAENVKDYLVSTWKINPNRISTKARNLPEVPSNNDNPDGQAENSRVEISSNDYNILQPVQLKEILTTSNPPVIEIRPEAYASEGIDSYILTVSQNNNIIREYSGDQVPEKLDWRVEEEPMPKFETQVNIDLIANDKNGQSDTTGKSLTINQLTIRKKRYDLNDDKIIERFSLIVFDFDQATITDKHKRILNEIKSRIKPESKVTIAGYTDRMGDPEYNKELARKRAQKVSDMLGIDKSRVSISAVGQEYLLYNNDLPQGRNYSRTVQIIVETPVGSE